MRSYMKSGGRLVVPSVVSSPPQPPYLPKARQEGAAKATACYSVLQLKFADPTGLILGVPSPTFFPQTVLALWGSAGFKGW